MTDIETKKAYKITIIMLVVLSVFSMILTVESFVEYVNSGDFSLAFLILMPVILCIGSTFAVYRRYMKIIIK